jgi:hypothetical protein
MRRTAFVLSCLFIPMIYITVFTVLGLIGNTQFSAEMQSMVITAVISGAMGTILGFFLGNSEKEPKVTK